MTRVLLLAATTGYQTRSFGEAADRLGVELVFATDRCDKIDDPWRDQAIPIRFFDEDHSVSAIIDAAQGRRLDGVLALGDRPTVIAARVAQALGFAGNPPEAAALARLVLRLHELNDGAVQMYLRDPAGNLVEVDWPDVSTLDLSIITPMSKLSDEVEQTREAQRASLYTGRTQAVPPT